MSCKIFRVSHFPCFTFRLRKFKLCLQNTLNMPKTTRVYFGVLQAKFTTHRGTLYKRGFSTPILKCVAKEDTNYMLREVHEGICRNHIEARSMVAKTLRQGYYWPTMLKDATKLVKRCKTCQEHAQISHLPSELLTSITSPWPFQQWGLDILGGRHIGGPTHWEGPVQVYCCGSGLLHQVGRGRATSNHHRAKGA